MKEASEGWGCDARQGPTNLTDTTQLLAALPKIVIPSVSDARSLHYHFSSRINQDLNFPLFLGIRETQ